MQPKATYLEKRMFSQIRSFELYADHVIVKTRFGKQPESIIKIELKNLRSEPNKLFILDKTVALLFLFFLAVLLPFFVMSIIALFRGLNGPNLLDLSIRHLLPIVAIAGFLVGLRFFYPPTEYAQFVQKDAGLPLLDVARSGPNKNKHGEFVNQLKSQIAKSQ